MKAFAETGRADGLDQRVGNAEGSVYDEFVLPAILSGGGRSEGKIFVDSNHTMVSLVTRIVPSPDWFIGVDSFQVSLMKLIFNGTLVNFKYNVIGIFVK